MPVERIAAIFAAQPMLAHLGITLGEVAAGRCALHLPRQPALTQQNGFLHAGALTTLADTACGFAAYTLMPEGANVLTAEFKLNLLRPADGDAVARAEVIRAGRLLSVARADIFCTGPQGERLCATMTATLVCQTG
jgi:uncharacterized protein (TIGR00369 family)